MKIVKSNDSALSERHYKFKKSGFNKIKKHRRDILEEKTFLSDFVRSIHKTYYEPQLNASFCDF